MSCVDVEDHDTVLEALHDHVARMSQADANRNVRSPWTWYSGLPLLPFRSRQSRGSDAFVFVGGEFDRSVQ